MMAKKKNGSKKAYKAMKTIMQYCRKNKECCDKCIFYRGGIINICCISFLHNPEQWDKRAVKKRIREEKHNENVLRDGRKTDD